MSTNYTPQTWADNDVTKPVSAARMGNIEAGIAAVDTASIAGLAGKAPVSSAWVASTAVKAGQILTNAGTAYTVNADFTTPSTFSTTGLTVVASGGGGGGAVSSVAGRTGAVVLAAGDVSGLPTALPPNGAAGGDLTGSYPNPGVAKIAGVTIAGTPTAGQVPTASSGTAAAWATPSGGGGGSASAGWIFGDGYQGDVVISANADYNAIPSGDLYFHNMTVNSGVTIRVNCRIFVTGTLTLNGTIQASATNPGSGSGGGASWGASTIGAPGQGANGGTAAGSRAATGLYYGGAGGAGGTGSGGAGGASQSGTQFSSIDGGVGIVHGPMFLLTPTAETSVLRAAGGGGGSGGGGDGTNPGGGGGTGGGVAMICAAHLAGTGTLKVSGENGAAGTGGNAGGGGGGGGGLVVITTRDASVPFTVSVAGGTGGSGSGTGAAGSAGSAGTVVTFLGS